MRRIVFILIVLTVISACGGGKKQAPIPEPSAAILSAPLNNEACVTGVALSDTESKINLVWSAASNVESYELTITNLLTKAQQTQSTTSTSTEITLKRNTPYSWFVTSKSTKTATTAKSSIWKFYNPGLGASSFPPYPAEIVSPTMGQLVNLNAGKITFQWKGSDADNDILNYDIYLGTNFNNLPVIKSQHTTTSLPDVSVNANTTYYWKVVSRDGKGNTSDSGLYEFKSN
jgi:hypothetical protein